MLYCSVHTCDVTWCRVVYVIHMKGEVIFDIDFIICMTSVVIIENNTHTINHSTLAGIHWSEHAFPCR